MLVQLNESERLPTIEWISFSIDILSSFSPVKVTFVSNGRPGPGFGFGR